MIVRLKKLPTGGSAQYQMLEIGFDVELLCFSSSKSSLFNLQLERANEKLKCADKEEIESSNNANIF